MVSFFEVIWLFDRTTNPPKPKMMVCLSYDDGFFLRINTSDKFRPCVAISNAENTWLDHDSYIECALLEIDEFELDESVMRNGIIGTVAFSCLDQVKDKLLSAKYLRPDDKRTLEAIFRSKTSSSPHT